MKKTLKEHGNKGIVITKELVISFVAGLVFGALIASCVYCSCISHHFPKGQDNQIGQTREKRQEIARKKIHQQKKEKYDMKKKDTNETESNETKNDN